MGKKNKNSRSSSPSKSKLILSNKEVKDQGLDFSKDHAGNEVNSVPFELCSGDSHGDAFHSVQDSCEITKERFKKRECSEVSPVPQAVDLSVLTPLPLKKHDSHYAIVSKALTKFNKLVRDQFEAVILGSPNQDISYVEFEAEAFKFHSIRKSRKGAALEDGEAALLPLKEQLFFVISDAMFVFHKLLRWHFNAILRDYPGQNFVYADFKQAIEEYHLSNEVPDEEDDGVEEVLDSSVIGGALNESNTCIDFDPFAARVTTPQKFVAMEGHAPTFEHTNGHIVATKPWSAQDITIKLNSGGEPHMPAATSNIPNKVCLEIGKYCGLAHNDLLEPTLAAATPPNHRGTQAFVEMDQASSAFVDALVDNKIKVGGLPCHIYADNATSTKVAEIFDNGRQMGSNKTNFKAAHCSERFNGPTIDTFKEKNSEVGLPLQSDGGDFSKSKGAAVLSFHAADIVIDNDALCMEGHTSFFAQQTIKNEDFGAKVEVGGPQDVALNFPTSAKLGCHMHEELWTAHSPFAEFVYPNFSTKVEDSKDTYGSGADCMVGLSTPFVQQHVKDVDLGPYDSIGELPKSKEVAEKSKIAAESLLEVLHSDVKAAHCDERCNGMPIDTLKDKHNGGPQDVDPNIHSKERLGSQTTGPLVDCPSHKDIAAHVETGGPKQACTQGIVNEPTIDEAFIEPTIVTKWAALFKPTSNFDGAEVFKLDHIDLSDVRESRKLIVPNAIAAQGSREWDNTIVGFFLGRRLPYFLVQKAASNFWDNAGLVKTLATDQGIFYFQFDSAAAVEAVLEGGPWNVAGKPLILQQWTPHLSIEKNSVSRVPVWVCFYNVPLEYWNQKGLSYIASMIGKPIQVDRMTATRGRITYARICIEVDAKDDWITSFDLEAANPRAGSEPITIRVEYQWTPMRCNVCKSFGHDCNRKPSVPYLATKPVWCPSQKGLKSSNPKVEPHPEACEDSQWTEVVRKGKAKTTIAEEKENQKGPALLSSSPSTSEQGMKLSTPSYGLIPYVYDKSAPLAKKIGFPSVESSLLPSPSVVSAVIPVKNRFQDLPNEDEVEIAMDQTDAVHDTIFEDDGTEDANDHSSYLDEGSVALVSSPSSRQRKKDAKMKHSGSRPKGRYKH